MSGYIGYSPNDAASVVESKLNDQMTAVQRNIIALWSTAITNAGYDYKGTFESGATATTPKDVIISMTTGKAYYWNGTLPASTDIYLVTNTNWKDLPGLGITDFIRTLLNDPDASTSRATLGAYAAAGGAITGDFWRSLYISGGEHRLGSVISLGSTVDDKSQLILLARKYVGTSLAKSGFIGRITFNRGSPWSDNSSDYIDLIVTSAYSHEYVKIVRKIGNSAYVTGMKIVEVTHLGVVYYALYRYSSTNDVIVTGHIIDPTVMLLIPDATGYSITDVVTQEEDYHKGNVVGTVSQSGGVPTGAVIERGSNVNGDYTKFADGTMICRGAGVAGSLVVVDSAIGTYGWSFFSSTIHRTFPALFAPSNQFLSISAGGGVRTDGASLGGVVSVESSTLSSVQLSVWCLDVYDRYVQYTAVGRWY